MKKEYYSNSQDYINRWIVSYADFVTMLLALFMVLYGLQRMNITNLNDFQGSVNKVFKKPTAEKIKEQTKITSNSANINPEITDLKNHFKNIDTSVKQDIVEFKNIESKIKSDPRLNGELLISKETRGLIIRLNDAVLFDPGSDIIKNDARNTLNKLAHILKDIPNPIKIEGHTDNSPIKTSQYPSNWELSTARSTKLISYLVHNHQFDPKRLSAVGYGEYMPIKDNQTANGRASNRRVDIVIMSSASEIFNPTPEELTLRKLENNNGKTHETQRN